MWPQSVGTLSVPRVTDPVMDQLVQCKAGAQKVLGKRVSSHISLSLGTLPEALVQLMDPVYCSASLFFQDEFVLSICHVLCSVQATLK